MKAFLWHQSELTCIISPRRFRTFKQRSICSPRTSSASWSTTIRNRRIIRRYELLGYAEEAELAEVLVLADVRLAAQASRQSRSSVPAPSLTAPVLMVTSGSAPSLPQKPVPKPRNVRLPEESEPFADLNTHLIRGVPSGNIDQYNPMCQVLVTLAMPDPATALYPDIGVKSNILMSQHCGPTAGSSLWCRRGSGATVAATAVR